MLIISFRYSICGSKFTLIEMLVVIAIISILASMLAPTLVQAQQSARATICANSKKQLGIAFGMYSSDWNNYCPPLATGFGTDPYNGSWTVFDWRRSLWGYAVEELSSKAYNPYDKSLTETVFYCPSEPVTTSGLLTSASPQGTYCRDGLNYDFTRAVTTPVTDAPQRFSYAKAPSRNLLVSEVYRQQFCTPYTYYFEGNNIGMGLVSHNYGSNCLFIDGHVEYRIFPSGFPILLASNKEFKIFWRGSR